MSYESDMEKAAWAYDAGCPDVGRRLVLEAVAKHPIRFWKDMGSRVKGGPLDQVLNAFESGGE